MASESLSRKLKNNGGKYAERHPALISALLQERDCEIARSAGSVELPAVEDGYLRQIFRLMRSATGLDFTQYEPGIIRQRIIRRMPVRQCETLAQFAEYVEDHPEELQVLSKDVLTHATAFFPEPELLEVLRNKIFPQIIASLKPGEPCRMWVPGCSTGEEVYFLAFALEDYLGGTPTNRKIQIFGTDLSDANIDTARSAVYPEAFAEGLSTSCLSRFLVKVAGGYRVVPSVRRMCVFGRHDLTQDPPFSRMDLISCRSMLSHFAPALRSKVVATLQYALKPTGFLILDQRESFNAEGILHSLQEQNVNIYSKTKADFELWTSQRELRDLSARLLTSAEEEGKKIARELHDFFGPALGRVNLKVSEVVGLLSNRPDLAQKLQGVAKEISEVAKSVHDLSRLLHPAAVSQLGLRPALEAEVATFSKLRRIAVKFSAENIPESLPEATAFCLYRVAQECLHNIQKHAEAKWASVTVSGRRQEIVMTVLDCGKGFDPHAVRGRGGLGLVSMEERVRLVNGKLSVHSKPGQGTRVEVRVPLRGDEVIPSPRIGST